MWAAFVWSAQQLHLTHRDNTIIYYTIITMTSPNSIFQLWHRESGNPSSLLSVFDTKLTSSALQSWLPANVNTDSEVLFPCFNYSLACQDAAKASYFSITCTWTLIHLVYEALRIVWLVPQEDIQQGSIFVVDDASSRTNNNDGEDDNLGKIICRIMERQWICTHTLP